MKHVVLVDPYAPARGLPPEFLRAGYPCVRVQSTAEVPAVYRGPLDLSGYVANVIHDGDIEDTIRRLSAYEPVAVLTGSELGVELADKLSESMGLDTNGTKLSTTRRDKFEMIERVASVGLRAPHQMLATDEAELRAWHEKVGGRIVVKPLRSAAGDGVTFCDGPDQSAAAFAAIMGRENIFSLPNLGVVAQEYLVGAEYIVNTVSRAGRHHVTDCWGSGRLSVNGITDLLVESVLLDQDAPGLDRMTAYAFDVLDALGIRYGPAHLEIKMTPDGPCVVEVGARISGGELPYFAAEAIGESQLDWTVDCYVRPERFDERCGTPYRLQHHFAWSALASPTQGKLLGYRGIEQIEALQSFRSLRIFVTPGNPVQPTVNDLTYPLTVTLHHASEGVLQRDLNTIRYLDGIGFYDVDQNQ
ncbi:MULTISPECIES: ATP-grasp domain-containing protein [Streptomyces]|uniref:ATP-grasp domain-containing protein n=1 Tax=Streptomyces TaxID=1883 RepID=UPI001E3CD4BF|nr:MULTISPECIES: ATP-grasp domain-containing protein [Streptomyces]UFQ19060.1 ATP-grasp domain-containing protein [Streptomyces huasconensis]WCL88679.1 ATP-grasp domain-containing protein [Streptomyces sp. JCM 35825]